MATNTNYVLSLSGINSKDKSEVGIPALELAELINANVPIPSGFIITQNALEHFAFSTQLDQKVKQLQQIGSFSEATLTKLILESEIPRDIYDDLSREYTTLSGISNIWMRIRAGLYDQTGTPLTYIDEKEINEVKGFEALELEIKKIWAKLLIIDQKYDSLGSFIIVQKLIPAEVSGIILTQDISNKDSNHIIIKSVFGELNDTLLDALDVYTFSKQEEKIVDRKIVPQKVMFIRSSKNNFGYEEVEISEKWQLRQKLADKYIEDLGYLGDYLENVFTKPQEVAWVFQAGKIWINYVKPISDKYTKEFVKVEEDIEKDMATLEPIIDKQAQDFEERTVDIEIPEEVVIENPKIQKQEEKIIEKKEEPEPDINVNLRAEAINQDVLVAGVGNNKGIVQGKVIFNREQCTENDILVIPEWDEMPKNAAAVIIEDIIAATSEFPLIYGAELASKILREGEYVRLDTDTGFIFEMPDNPKESASNMTNEDLSTVASAKEEATALENAINNEEEIEEIKPQVQPHPQPKVEKEIIPKLVEEVVVEPEPVKKVEEIVENIPTAIKVIAHVSNHSKDDVKFNDGYFLDLPHGGDYFLSKENVDYKAISNLIYNFALPFLKNSKDTLIYNIFDVNPAVYIKNSDLILVQCEAIHKLRSKENMRHLQVALPKFKNIKQLREFRKSLSAAGLRRSSTFKIFIKIAYSSNIFELPTYLEDRFDGVIVSLEALHNSLYSSDRKLVRVTNTLLKALAQIQKDCRAAKVAMILDLKGVKLTKAVITKLDPYINYGISVIPKYTEFTKKYIAELERRRIFR